MLRENVQREDVRSVVIIGLAREKDRLWVEKLIHRHRLPAQVAADGEAWDILVDGQGNVRGGGQVITCGLEGHCTLTASSLLQEGGMATLQRTMHTLAGQELQPRELSLAQVDGPVEHKLTAAAVLLLLGREI